MKKIFTASIFDVEGKDVESPKNTKKDTFERIIIRFLLLAFLYFGAHVVVYLFKNYGG